jgi:hypothetical protein
MAEARWDRIRAIRRQCSGTPLTSQHVHRRILLLHPAPLGLLQREAKGRTQPASLCLHPYTFSYPPGHRLHHDAERLHARASR